MTDHDRLSEVLSDAVSDVEPAHRLDAIRERTGVTSIHRRRRVLSAATALVATAAASTAFVLVSGDRETTTDPGVATQSPSPSPSATVAPEGGSVIPVYYLGETPAGPRLFRYFEPTSGLTRLVPELEVITRTPSDPDYRTIWPQGAFEGLSDPEAGFVRVQLDPSLRDRPDGISEEEARLAIQQVVYTLHASFQEEPSLSVQFFDDRGEPMERVLGVPTSGVSTSGVVEKEPELDVLSLVSISDPAEGQVVDGAFVARGRASSFEATVPWEIRRGDDVVLDGFATAEGWMDGLYPWETEVDVSSLEPGTYTFAAMTDDPSGGAEGAGPYSDTRTIVVE